MTKRYTLGPSSEIPSGEGRTFRVGGSSIAVFRGRDGRFFATQAECPHRGGPLANGLLGGTTLICPLHEWAFDLSTGMALNGDCGVRVYPVVQDASGTLVVEMADDGGPPPFRITDYSKETTP
jgi:nitrite reductase (NADH) small subunit